MTEFVVDGDGLLKEKLSLSPNLPDDADPLVHETHQMLIRAYTSLTAAARRNNPSSQSLGRYNVLRLLHHAPGHRLLMSEIGDGLETSPTVVTRLIDALVADGLVRRVEHPDDKRKTWGEITDAGSRLFMTEEPLMMREIERLWSGMAPEEMKLLAHLLARLRLNILSRQPGDLPRLDEA